MRWLGVDDLDIAVVLAVPLPAQARFQTANDHVGRPLGVLERAVGVACLWWGRQVTLVAVVFRLLIITSLIITVIVVSAATSVVVVATRG
jgi:hypothetical protein